MNWRVKDSSIFHGAPTFRGTRVMVSTVLGYLADGSEEAEDVHASFARARRSRPIRTG